MKFLIRITAVALALGATLHVSSALADDDDKAACADKAQGDACTDGDGEAGTCVPDDSDPVLTCDNDASSSSSGTGSGSGSGTGSGSSSGTGSNDDGSDDDGSNDDSSSGCSASPQLPSSWAGALAGLGAVGLAASRRRGRR